MERVKKLLLALNQVDTSFDTLRADEDAMQILRDLVSGSDMTLLKTMIRT